MLTLAEFKQKLAVQQIVNWSEKSELESLWVFDVKASRDEAWKYVSDTSRFNRELGLTPRQQEEKDGKLHVTTTMLGFAQEWIEDPWTWLAGETIGCVRRYSRGMAKRSQTVFHIEDAGDFRRVYVYFGWQPANAFWKLFLQMAMPQVKKKFAANFAKLNVHSSALSAENAFRQSPEPLSDDARQRLHDIQLELNSRNLPPDLVRRLCEFVATGDEMDLETIRILPLARQWKVDTRDLLVASLHATRLGLLKISWEVICPHCRGSRFSAGTLGDIPEESECGICEVDFTTDQAESVEVVFHVHPSIRKISQALYCAAEPAKKTHIKIQQRLQPGQTVALQAPLREGIYRARARGAEEFKIQVKRDEPANIRYTNPLSTETLFVVEELWWESTALRPAQVFSLPDFRDLFSEEHLSSNVKLYVGEQAILFTDIVGSTKFYSQVGDAKAFKEVRAHFQEVFGDVRAHHGVVVKTIGDAVMAAFSSPQEALAAAVEIQRRFHLLRADTSIRLRISVHSGPVIAVQLNTGIDYFGNTVNFAAKIQGVAGACEIAMSDMIYTRHLPASGFTYPIDKRKSANESVGNADVYVLKIESAAKAAS